MEAPRERRIGSSARIDRGKLVRAVNRERSRGEACPVRTSLNRKRGRATCRLSGWVGVASCSYL